jgi:hypothetical protein
MVVLGGGSGIVVEVDLIRVACHVVTCMRGEGGQVSGDGLN